MFATNPFGNAGIICDKCSIVIAHEIDSNTATKLAHMDHFCVRCYEEFEEVTYCLPFDYEEDQN
jgi:hypothetical protein